MSLESLLQKEEEKSPSWFYIVQRRQARTSGQKRHVSCKEEISWPNYYNPRTLCFVRIRLTGFAPGLFLLSGAQLTDADRAFYVWRNSEELLHCPRKAVQCRDILQVESSRAAGTAVLLPPTPACWECLCQGSPELCAT